MAQHRCWLVLAACALSVAAASARTADDDGICIRVKQYVLKNGRRALEGTTVTYCSGESVCRRWAVRACCNGWRRDPDSKKLRCIKVDATDSATIGAVGDVADLDSAERSASIRDVWNYLKRVDGGRKNVRRPRGSENSPDDRSKLNVASSTGPAQTPPQKESQTNSGNVVGSASSGTIQSSTDGKQPVGNLNSGAGDTQLETNSATGVPLPATSNKDSSPTAPQKQPVGSPTNGAVDTQPKSNTVSGAPLPAASNKDTPPTTPEKQPEGPPISGAGDTQPKTNSAIGAPLPSTGNKDTPPTNPQNQPVQSPTNGTGNTQPKTNSASGVPLPATNNKDSPPPSPQKGSSNSGDGSGSSQVSSKNGPASTGSQLVVNPSQPVAPSHVDPPMMVQPRHTNNASNPSASTRSDVELQPAAKDDRNSRLKDTNQMGGGPVGHPTPPTLATSENHDMVTPAMSPPTLLSVYTNNSNVQPQGHQPVAPQRPASGTTATTTPPVPTTSIKGSESGRIISPTGENITAVSTPSHSSQNRSSTAQSTQDTGSLELTRKDLEHGQRVDTIPSPASLQPTSVPAIPIASTSTVATPTTEVPLPAPININTTCANGSHPQSVNATHPAQEGTSNNNVPSAPPTPPVTTNTTSINIITLTAAATTTTTANTITTTTTAATITQPTQSISHDSTKSNATNVPATQHPNNQTDKNYYIHDTNGSSTPATLTTSNGINHTATPQTSTTPPVAKPLGEKPRGGGALPSGRSASQTASEVTISLLLVAAVAFVAALLYWRARRREQRYVSYGTHAPSQFSNPVYDLEAMMERTSLVKLQNAADVEDGELSELEREATFERK